MRNLFAALKSAIQFVRAGNALDRKEYQIAQIRIDRAMDLVGSEQLGPKQFEYFLRAAMIEQYSNTAKALRHLSEAKARLEQAPKLSVEDRLYLLDFCDVLLAELSVCQSPELRLRSNNWRNVTAHYRRKYPLEAV